MTELEIWNRALGALPHDKRVESLTEDSTEALRCRDHFDASRLHVLAAHEWGWALRSMPMCDGCYHAGKYAYPRPQSAARIVGLFGMDGRQVDAIAIDGMFLSSSPAASIRYVYDEKNVEHIPPAVAQAIMYELASRIALPITSNNNTERTMTTRAMSALSDARLNDAQEVRHSGVSPDYYAESRR